MAILVTIKEIQEEPLLLDRISIEKSEDSGCFWLFPKANQTVGLRVEIPYGSALGYDSDDTEVLILQNPFQGEADVLEVFVVPGSHRIGYSFSSASAGSQNHRLSNCKYFQSACRAAVHKTLEKIVSDDARHNLGIQRLQCTLGELLDKEISVLTIHKPWLNAIEIQSRQLIASLYRYGYTLTADYQVGAPLRLDSAKDLFVSTSSNGHLKIAVTTKWLAEDELIGRFIGQRLSCPSDSILRFFYLYQIVERLIELETRRYSSKLISTLGSSGSKNSIKVMTAFHDFKETLSEKNRIRSLFGERSNNVLLSSPTISKMVEFLAECDIYDEKDTTYGDLLYRVRNVVFHGWWSLPGQVDRRFLSVIAGLEIDIPEMLLNYTGLSPLDDLATSPDVTVA